ncbi:MAG: EamA family transporter [Rhizobiaceae bacterium]|nr:EamA family transporter [Rhizobiaceae bacterium]
MDTFPLRHFVLALTVVAVWGTNFVIIKIGLDHLPPLFFGAARFLLASLPCLFLPRPKVPIGQLAAYGLLIGSAQFGFLLIAMRGEISPGLASLVLQMQVFFTIGLAVLLTGERVRGFQYAALGIAVAGICIIAANTDATTSALGLGLVILAAASWAGGNIVAKRSGVTDMLPFVVWGSLFSAPPLFALSFLIEGFDAIRLGIATAEVATWAALIWQAVGNTLFGYAVWGWLLSRHPAALVTPMALLVPVFGMTTSAIVLQEALPAWKLLAAALVISGLAIGLVYPRWSNRLALRKGR